jgi:serine/threonine protein kinase
MNADKPPGKSVHEDATLGTGPNDSEQTGTLPHGAAHASPGPPSRLPAEFGRYKLLQLLGKGGMGAVYLAHDTQLDRSVALKMPTFSLDAEPALKERFFREARAAATLLHANICPVHDVGVINGTHYLTMAYIEGRPLADLVEPKAKPLPPRQIAQLIRKLALALEEAHRKKIIHRDLKPANVMITPQGEPILMDFGLARRAGKDARLTQDGDVMGTPVYMAPEQARGNPDEMGPWTDIYSLGVILYVMLAGRPPFTGDMMAIFSQVLCDEPQPPSAWRKDADPALEAICKKAMARKPEARYPSMAEFARALTDFLKSNPSPLTTDTLMTPAPDREKPKPSTPENPVTAVLDRPSSVAIVEPVRRPTPRQHPQRSSSLGWLWGLGAAMVAIGLGVGLFFYFRDRFAPRPEETVAAGKGTVRFELSDPKAAVEITIDGKPVPLADAVKGVSLVVGEHRLEGKGKGYRPFALSFFVKEGGNETMPVKLQRLTGVWTDENVRNGRILAPELSRVEPRTQFVYGPYTPGGSGRDENKWCDNGLLTIKNGVWIIGRKTDVSNFAFEITGRAINGTSWGVIFERMDEDVRKGGIAISLGTGGDFTIEPSPWRAPENPTASIPWTTHPAIHKGAVFNTLLVMVRDRRLEVYVNQRAVCKPLELEHDIGPGFVQAWRGPRPGRGVAEFHVSHFWKELSGVPSVEERKLVAEPKPPVPLAWPAKPLADSKIKAPDLSKAKTLGEIRFSDAKRPFAIGKPGEGVFREVKDGKYLVQLSKAMTYSEPATAFVADPIRNIPKGELACELVGKATGDQARWGVAIASAPGSAMPCRVNVMIRNTGHLLIETGTSGATLKHLDEVKHPAIKTGPQASNSLLVIVRGRTVEVYVNRVAVCNPIPLEHEISTPTLALLSAATDAKGATAEFESIALRSAEGLPTPEQHGAVPRK